MPGNKIMKNNFEIETESDIECTNIFIKKYNVLNHTNYQDVVKSAVQNEKEFFCYTPDYTDYLKIQIETANPVAVAGLAKGKKKSPPERTAAIKGSGQFLMRIPNNIQAIEVKCIKEQKDISNTVLILDEVGMPPDFLLNEVKKNIKTSAFKEVWIVCRNNTVFKLF